MSIFVGLYSWWQLVSDALPSKLGKELGAYKRIADAFEKVMGRKPTLEEAEAVLRAVQSLWLGEAEPFWERMKSDCMMACFNHYRSPCSLLFFFSTHCNGPHRGRYRSTEPPSRPSHMVRCAQMLVHLRSSS